MKRKRMVIAAFTVAAVLVGSVSSLKADSCGVGRPPIGNCLFYSGDFNRIEGLHNILNGYDPRLDINAIVYDNIIVPPGGWTVNSLFTNDAVSGGDYFTEAYWEIRSGVRPGQGGTLVASGTASGPDVSFKNGQDQWWGFGETIEADGLAVFLKPGQYWISVTPIGTYGSSMSDESATSFSNCVDCAGHQSNVAYWTSSYFGSYFQPTYLECHVYAPCHNFSFGVAGSAGVPTAPEPGTLMLLGSSLIALAARVRRSPSSK